MFAKRSVMIAVIAGPNATTIRSKHPAIVLMILITHKALHHFLFCDEACQGCSYCEGIHYINSIRTQENMEDYEQAVDDGDVDAIVAVETDDECMEINEGSKEAASTEYYQPCINSSDWNPSNLSFWEMREKGKTMKGAAAQRNQHLNSSCSKCFTTLHCQNCETNNQNPSAKKSASFIKEFAMRTTLMELGVIYPRIMC